MSLTRDEAEKKIADLDKKRGNLELATRQALAIEGIQDELLRLVNLLPRLVRR